MYETTGHRGRASGRHRSSNAARRSAELQNLILRMRRARRVFRPHFAYVIRLFIVLFTVMELRPTVPDLDGALWPFVLRSNTLFGMLASVLSVIYFDIKAFSYIVVASIAIKAFFDMHTSGPTSIHKIAAWTSFHATAVLFSLYIGRRRSISKPLVFKHQTNGHGFYTTNLRNTRYVDILEAGIRLQSSLLAIDYSLASRAGASRVFVTLPFAALFAVGYCTYRNGAVVLVLLVYYATGCEVSPILGFNLVKSVSTVAAAVLALSVGPGIWAVDEWLSTASQLCY